MRKAYLIKDPIASLRKLEYTFDIKDFPYTAHDLSCMFDLSSHELSKLAAKNPEFVYRHRDYNESSQTVFFKLKYSKKFFQFLKENYRLNECFQPMSKGA